MTTFRFYLSTSAPASGLRRTIGANEKNPTRARAVAWPVTCHA